MTRLEHCHSCNGPIKTVSGPGRRYPYRGVSCELPHDLEVDTCTACGAEWMSGEQVDRMSKAFEAQRAAAVSRQA